MDEEVALAYLFLDELVELCEEFADVLGLGVEEGVDDVMDGGLEGDVVEACGGCYDWVGRGVPVWMSSLRMKSGSRADWMSPM